MAEEFDQSSLAGFIKIDGRHCHDRSGLIPRGRVQGIVQIRDWRIEMARKKISDENVLLRVQQIADDSLVRPELSNKCQVLSEFRHKTYDQKTGLFMSPIVTGKRNPTITDSSELRVSLWVHKRQADRLPYNRIAP